MFISVEHVKTVIYRCNWVFQMSIVDTLKCVLGKQIMRYLYLHVHVSFIVLHMGSVHNCFYKET